MSEMEVRWLRAAHTLWFRSLGARTVANEGARESHALQLILLCLQDAIGGLSGAVGTSSGCERPLPTLLPHDEEVDGNDAAPFDRSAGVQAAPGGSGFRCLRNGFASESECTELRAAALAAMVSAFRRGGQTSLAVVEGLPERLAATGSAASYTTLFHLLERVRRACAEDDAAARDLGAETCPICGTRRGTKRDASEHPATSSSRRDAPTQGPTAATPVPTPVPTSALYHRGALLVRLHAPEMAEAVAPATWALRALQDYWEPHVDQHNAADYDVSAVLYLTSQGEHFEGGSFAFHDAERDTVIEPTAGDLLTFSSGAGDRGWPLSSADDR